jgi:PKD repeat protein
MLKRFLTSAAVLLLFITFVSAVSASGKMEVPLGEKVTLQADTSVAGTYKWVVTKGRDIVSTQTGSIFSHTFDIQGEYKINLTATDASGAIKSTDVNVLVGDRYSAPTGAGSSGSGDVIDAPLRVHVDTLPTTTSEQSVHIAGDEGRVVFDIASRPDILEYRIDRNVYKDSDGNGIANDDIDNADHSSYLLGGVWQTRYQASESNKIAAEITVVNTAGLKSKTQVEIIFGSAPAKEGNVVAILDTLPVFDQTDQKIYVYGDKDTVAFYPRRSQGDIIEYRIDKNIFVDSDGDGNPANDIDNRNDLSFKSGEVWLTDYTKTDQQIIAQLIVVGRGGTGSRIQREIEFTDAPEVSYEETSGQTESVIQLAADKPFAQKGDPVVFSVSGLAQDLKNYIFEWDFNGDGEADQTVEGENTVTYIYDSAAIQPVKVKVMDLDGNEASFTLDFLVKDVASTRADFDYEIDGLTVNFTNLSEASPTLTSRILDYTWSFGDTDPDNYEAQRGKTGSENPSYTYVEPGTYVVTLTVVDSDQVTDTRSAEIVIAAPEGYEETVAGEDTEVSEGTPASGERSGSVIGAIFKWVLYIILFVIALIVLIISGLLIFLKIQHPDLVFEELIDELKIKLLAMMGVHEMIEPVAPAQEAPATPSAAAPVTPEPSKEVPLAEPESPAAESAPEEDLSKADAPMPDWLKPKQPRQGETPADSPAAEEVPQKEVIEGEVEEEVPPAPAPKPTPKPAPAPQPKEKPDNKGDLDKNNGPVPDWLKKS